MKWKMFRKKLKEGTIDLLLWCGCAALISSIWTAVEIYYHGAYVVRPEDTVMAFIFSAFGWLTVHRWNNAHEPKRGTWEAYEHPGYLCCSSCHNAYVSPKWLSGGRYNYCPNCGAKMDKEGKT